MQTGATAQLLQALFGRFVVHFQRGELEAAHEIARKLLRIADEQRDVAGQVASCRTAGAVLFQLGDFAKSRAHLERGLALYNSQRDRGTGSIYAIDSRVVCLHWLSQGLLSLGHPDQAQVSAEEALAWAREIAHPSSIAHALCGVSFTYQRLGRRREAQAEAERLITFAREQGFPLWGAAGLAIHGWALADEERSEEGIAEILRGLADYIATGAGLWVPDFLALNAEAHGLARRPDAGLRLVADALGKIRGGRRWIELELHRLRGELLLALPDAGAAEAEACFRHAIAMASQNSARMLELRAATSLARLWAQQRRRAEAHDLLAPVYGWFTEGFDTADLKEAAALLDELA